MNRLDNYKDIVYKLHDILNADIFMKQTGSQHVRENMTKQFIAELLDAGYITTKESGLLNIAIDCDEQHIPRGTKVKIRNILIKALKPLINEYVDSINKEKTFDLNLPSVDQVLSEIKFDKLSVPITGGQPNNTKDTVNTCKKDTSNKAPSSEEHKVDSVSNTDIKEDTCKDTCTTSDSTLIGNEYAQKDIISSEQKVLLKQLRNKLYNKDKIEVFPNQQLSTFITGDAQLSDYKVDMVICDKETLNIICTVVIMSKVEIDFTATLLNKLNIKRFVIKSNNGILDTQDIRALEEEINNRYAPMCKMCGLPMTQKENIKTRHRFYACMDNQNCRYTIDMGD